MTPPTGTPISQREGRCYAVCWDTYGVAVTMPIVARNVIELVTWLVATDGTSVRAPLGPFGDPYDGR